MRCFVYRSSIKSDTYVYVCQKDDLSMLPEGLKKLLGKTEYALELDLDKTKRLSNADVKQVRSSLSEQGYYLQLPKEHHISE